MDDRYVFLSFLRSTKSGINIFSFKEQCPLDINVFELHFRDALSRQQIDLGSDDCVYLLESGEKYLQRADFEQKLSDDLKKSTIAVNRTTTKVTWFNIVFTAINVLLAIINLIMLSKQG